MRHTLPFCLLACTALCAPLAHAQTVALPTPQNGTWVVKQEADGEPGRGMAIDVQNGQLALQVFGYTPDGQPTFHMASGALRADSSSQNSTLTAPLQHYRGGRHFGGEARTAELAGNAGPVTLTFTSAHGGTVQFPGEAPVAIERMLFDTRLQHEPIEAHDAFTGHLHDVRGPAHVLAQSAFHLNLVRYGNGKQPELTFSNAGEALPSPLPCVPDFDDAGNAATGLEATSPSPATQWLCAKQEPNGSALAVRLQLHANEVLGELRYTRQYPDAPAVLATAQLRGTRHYYSASNEWTGEAAHYAYSTANPQYLVPRSGLWVIEEERNGEPCRGLAIDVQGDTLVVQMHGYDTDGAPTFHLAATRYLPGEANEAMLYHYEGGRYFGSGPRTARNAGAAGMMTLWFDELGSGTVQLPGEMPQKIVRLPLLQPQDPANLRGLWRFDTRTGNALTVALDDVQGDRILSADGLFACAFAGPGADDVTCTKSPPDAATGHRPYTFTFRWEPDLTSVYGEMVDPMYGERQGAGISRIAYASPVELGVYFSPGSRLTLPLRNPD